jgi:hypothetical protein
MNTPAAVQVETTEFGSATAARPQSPSDQVPARPQDRPSLSRFSVLGWGRVGALAAVVLIEFFIRRAWSSL